jgi:hypothetical protein
MAERFLSRQAIAQRQAPRVTVAVVTRDLRADHAQKCISRLKQHTRDFDLWVLDNNSSPEFNHSVEMNKVLRAAQTDHVVLMDDDVFVESDWLPGLLRSMDRETGLVVPMHCDAAGVLSFSGIYLMGDDLGTHGHLLDVPAVPRVTQCVCGALMLVDRRKCGALLFNEELHKYFLDIDFSLRIWECGLKVVCTPEVTVTHVGGATVLRNSRKMLQRWNVDGSVFVRCWIDSRRLPMLEGGIWSLHPFLQTQSEIPRLIHRLTRDQPGCDASQLEGDVQLCQALAATYPLFCSLLVTGLRQLLRRSRERNAFDIVQVCERYLQRLAGTIEVRGGVVPLPIERDKGYEFFDFGSEFFAVPLVLGPVDVRNEECRRIPGLLVADSLSSLRSLVDAHPLPPDIRIPVSRLDLLVSGYEGAEELPRTA